MDGRQPRDEVYVIDRVLHCRRSNNVLGSLGTANGIVPFSGQTLGVKLCEDSLDLRKRIRSDRNGTGRNHIQPVGADSIAVATI